MERRLAAILAADAVGYSRLMGADEEAALAERRAIIDAIILERGGRIFGSAGDSVIAEFSSSVAATRCAVEIQDRLRTVNQNLTDTERMDFRIGVHVGDVMVENGDLLGDGVNVAARIEGLAPTGGVSISSQVAGQISGAFRATFASAGTHRLKNIAKPVEVWCWPSQSAASLRRAAGRWKRTAAWGAKAAVVALAAGYTLFFTGADLSSPTTPKQAGLTPALQLHEAGQEPAIDEQPRQLTATAFPADGTAPDLPRKLQSALSKAGCSHGVIDGVWGRNSQSALERFAKYAKVTLPGEPVSVETLSLFEQHQGQICPPVCRAGHIDLNGTCVAMTCPQGQSLNASGNCVSRNAGKQFTEEAAVPRKLRAPAKREKKKRRGVPYAGTGADCDFVSSKSHPVC